jgi:hypothetical protein
MAKTTKMDLAEPVNINGVQYDAGKGVEVQSEHVTAVKDVLVNSETARTYAATHHGAVPAPNDPMEATAQTPTRPLGAEHVRVEETFTGAPEQKNAQVVEDPNQGNEAAKQEAKGADVVSAKDADTAQAVADRNSK